VATTKKKAAPVLNTISFEEIMFTIMSATQDTFKMYTGVDVFAGKVEKKIDPVGSDVVGIIGVAGDRVGYILFATETATAIQMAKDLLMMDEPDDDSIRDAIGEVTNNIAGAFKTKYHEQYGNVALGLPLVVAGKIRPMTDPPEPASGASMSVQCKGVTIPFKTLDGTISFRVMVYM
jgi:CheY-specific phosphatase CheX